MLDFAQLGISIDSKDTKRAAGDLDKFTRASDRAETQTKKTGRASDKAAKQVDGYAAATGRATVATKSLGGAATIAAVGVAKLVGIMGGMFLGLAGVGLAVRTIGGFEKGMARVAAITRATDVELAALRDTAKSLGGSTEFSAGEVAEGLSFLGMAGFNATEAIAAMPAVLDLATAGEIGLGQAADLASNIMSGFGIAAEDAADAIDLIAAVSTRANTNIPQLGSAMSLVAPVALAAGQTIEGMAAAIGVLGDAGIQGSRAGTSLRTALAKMLDPTDKAKAALKDLGLKASDINPQLHSLEEIIGTMAEAGLDAGPAFEIFGTEGAAGILALTANTGRLTELTAELQNVEGAVKDMATTMRDQLIGDAQTLGSALANLAITLGEAGLTNAIRGALKLMTQFVNGLTALVEGTSEWTGTIEVLTAALIAFYATAIPGAIGGMVKFGATALAAVRGVTLVGAAAAVSTKAVGVLRLALIAFGGPVGVIVGLLTGAAFLVYRWRDSIFTTVSPTQNAAEATAALNDALREFHKNEAPAAASAAITLAADQRQLAEDTLLAAEAHVAALRVELSAAQSMSALTNSVDVDKVEQFAAEDLANALVHLTDMENAVTEARGNQDRSARAVTSSMFGYKLKVDETTKATDEATTSTNAFVTSLGTIEGSLDGVSDQAIHLASIMGITADEAERMVRALNKGTGIPNPTPDAPRLSFGSGVAGMPEITEPGLEFSPTSDSPMRDAFIKAQEEFDSAVSGGGGGKKATSQIVDTEAAFARLQERLDPVVARAKQLSDAQQVVNDALAAGDINATQAASAMDQLTQAYGRGASAMDDLKSASKSFFDEMVTGSGNAKSALASLATQLASMFFDQAFSGIWDAFGSSSTGGAVQGFFDMLGFNARGTDNWRGGATVVGEEGPEIVNLPPGTEIIPADQSRAIMRGGSDFGRSGPPTQGGSGGISAGAPTVNVEPVIEVHNHNYFDRDQFVGDYLDSPAGRSKTINIVDEEGGVR